MLNGSALVTKGQNEISSANAKFFILLYAHGMESNLIVEVMKCDSVSWAGTKSLRSCITMLSGKLDGNNVPHS